jgi:anti-sigma regulatory factor (Ser/Thr protein kinase)
MTELKFKYEVPSADEDFTRAGEASGSVKKKLRQIGYNPEAIRKVSIAMYEGEINMAIHANGGEAEVEISSDRVIIRLTDHGPGIPDVNKAMQEGWSTAPEEVRNLGFGAGMGLPNMKKYSDDMKIDTKPGKGTTITMVINAA